MTEPDPRRETEEAARTGRFPDDDGGLRDDSTPVEREVPPEDVDDATLRLNEAYPLNDLRSPSKGARPDPIAEGDTGAA